MAASRLAPEAIDTSTPVLIFGLSRDTFHHGALGIARSAGRLGIPVYRISTARWGPAASSRYSRGWWSISRDASPEAILETLRVRAERIGRALLVPIDDVSSVFVEENADALSERFLFPRQPPGLARSLSSKQEMHRLCLEHGIPTPWSAFPQDESELLERAAETSFPVVLKCINAGDAPPSAPRVAIVQDPDELLDAYRTMQSPSLPNLMLQEYVPGTPESVWMFNGYFDGSSDCRLGFTGKKIRQSPPYTGMTTLGECRSNPVVEEMTVRLMKALSYRGILDIGYRFDDRTGEYKLLDVNPRIGGTFRLFVAHNGVDVLRAMYLDLTGQAVPAGSAGEGRRWLVEPLDLASSAVYASRGEITLRRWIGSLRGIDERAWFAADDPLPFVMMWLRLLVDWLPRRVLRRLLRRRDAAGPPRPLFGSGGAESERAAA